MDGCLICSCELEYLTSQRKMDCSICGKEFESNASCKKGHFVCDSCHQMGGMDYIETYCLNSQSVNPIKMADSIMLNPNIKMHGPEHHFLVPAVLITAYYNKIGNEGMIAKKIKVARERAKNILGGFCGFYGSCGACMGNGVFMSIVLDSTPLSKNEWKLANLLTSESLKEVAIHGGPRCCKRDTYLALETAISFLKENLDIDLESSEIVCGFHTRNKECLHKNCPYYPQDIKVEFSLDF